MRLAVDAAKCSGHGRCYTVAPQLLDADDEGFVTARGSTLEVASTLMADAHRAAASCPEEAISLTDEPARTDENGR
jgi:ferredoxin